MKGKKSEVSKTVEGLELLLPYGYCPSGALRLFDRIMGGDGSLPYNLVKMGYVQKMSFTNQADKKKAKCKCFAITTKGVKCLAKNSQRYKWIEDLIYLPEINIWGDNAATYIYRVAEMQEVSIMLRLAGVETIYDRMSSIPAQVGCDMLRSMPTNSERSFGYLIADMMFNTVDEKEKERLKEFSDRKKTEIQMDKFWTVREKAVAVNGDIYENTVMQSNHLGSVVGCHADYMIFATNLHGAKWLTTAINKWRPSVTLQMSMLGSKRAYQHISPEGIIFCRTPKEFGRALLDPYDVRSSSNKRLGSGLRNSYLIPMDSNGVNLLHNLLKMENPELAVERRVKELSVPGKLYIGNEQTRGEFPCTYVDSDGNVRPCAIGNTFSLNQIYKCFDYEGLSALFVEPWQIPFYETINSEYPNIRYVQVDSKRFWSEFNFSSIV